MACATCGGAVMEGGTCGICDPWQTPQEYPARPAAAAGVPMAPEQPLPLPPMGPIHVRGAYPVDLEAALRNSRQFMIFRSGVFIIAGLGSLAEVANRNVTYGSLLLLLFGPLVPWIAATRVSPIRSRGWLAGAIANLRLRPDIGVKWLLNLDELKRLKQVANISIGLLTLSVFVHVLVRPQTQPGLQVWAIATAVTFVAFGLVQIWAFARFSVPACRTVQARLAVGVVK